MLEPINEYEPLIDHRSKSQRLSSISAPPAARSIRTWIFSLALLLSTALFVFFLSRQDWHAAPPAPRTTNWLRMEQSHPRPAHIPKSWEVKDECQDQHPFILTLALKQMNTDALDGHVRAVSHPANKDTFHKYWSAEEVRSYFKPSTEALDAVTAWLEQHGFNEENGKINMVSAYGNVIRVYLTCGDANRLLNTKYMFYQNKNNKETHLRVKDGEYNIPEDIYQYIDFISPTIRFPVERHTLSVETMDPEHAQRVRLHTRENFKHAVTPKAQHSMNLKTNADGQDSTNEDAEPGLDDEDRDANEITANVPARLYELYGMTESVSMIIGSDDDEMDTDGCRQAIASFIEQYYNDNDIETFWENLDVYPTSEMERVPDTQPEGFGSEAELDTQYITSTGKGIHTYVYYIDSDDIFVSLVEQILATDIPPLVVSISYGADEYELGEDWVTRCNEEFGKLALIGTTVLASSGDSGIRGNDEDCLQGDILNYRGQQGMGGSGWSRGRAGGNGGLLGAQNAKRRRMHTRGEDYDGQEDKADDEEPESDDDEQALDESETDEVELDEDELEEEDDADMYSFIASFPASAPYVTAVGGTEGGLVQDDIGSTTGETAWLYSGGGFSIYFDTPDWQMDAVQSYLANEDIEFPDPSRYQNTGRAYPDLSAQSVDYVIAYDSAFYLVSGTSASSPAVAGMISMINYARVKNGKTSLGFLNPTLYSLYESQPDFFFNDVTQGNNIGCSVDDGVGFFAARGWDPLTGVGTPKFSRLYDALLAMP